MSQIRPQRSSRTDSPADRLSSLNRTPVVQSCDSFPDDGPNHIFLVRALQQVGRSRSGDAWQPELIAAHRPREIEDAADEFDMSYADDVASILKRISPDQVPSDEAIENAAWGSENDWVCESYFWQAAVKHRQTEILEYDCQVALRVKAVEGLLSDLRAGIIGAFIREIDGGPYEEFPASKWNFENYGPRFDTGEVNAEAPFALFDPDETTHYIFVDAEQLNRCYSAVEEGLSEERRLIDLWPHMSPLLKTAVIAADEIRRRGSRPSPEDLTARLIDLAWSQGVTLKKDLARRMVTIVRDEEARQGRKQNKS